MLKWSIPGGLVVMLVLIGVLSVAHGQVPPVAVPAVQVQYVPITIVIDLDAAKAKIIQELNGPQNPPGFVPPPGFAPSPGAFPGPLPPPGVRGRDLHLPPGVFPPAETRRQLFKGKLIQKLKENKPLQKLAAALAEQLEVKQELEKISQPVSLGNDLWLSLNMREIVLQGVNIQGLKQAVVHVAVQMEPTIVLSKEKPAPMPLPQFALGKELPPPSPTGTPLNIFLRIDPKAVPQVLPPDAKQELAKYGIDPAEVTFNQQLTKEGPKLTVTTPLQKPLVATLQVSFVPVLKDNVLSFASPECQVTLPTGNQADNSVQQALQKVTQEAIRAVVVTRLKETTVDFVPHLKKLATLPVGPPAAANKVQATISNLRVEDLGAANNHLLAHITGVVSKEGIVVFAP